jgi:alpha-galactosidase
MKIIPYLFLFFLSFQSGLSAAELIRIDTDNASMIMSISKDNQLLHQYFGKYIKDVSPFLLKQSYRRSDYGADPQVYGAAGGRDFREPALRVTHADGDLNTELVYKSHSQQYLTDGNIQETKIFLSDRKLPLSVILIFRAFRKENVITQRVEIKNEDNKEIVLHQFYSMSLPVKAEKYYLNTFTGAWAREMMLEETLLTHGMKSVESKKGIRTTHTENPSFLLSLDAPMAENDGEVIAGALSWSGNYKLNFGLDEFNVLNILSGINPYASAYYLKPGETFYTPEMTVTYSCTGAGGASRNLHDWARNYVVYDAQTIRPTLLNSWEGAYFSFNEKILTEMIDDAAEMGLEMFVLDDGWFGNEYPRDAANAGLGDWQVNKAKLPRGIAYVADYAVKKGLQFGIWIEPEMVNPQSVLAQKHPDWIVKRDGREVTTMRQQWLLDVSNPEVQDYIFNVFDQTMKLSKNISYIKWDANRHVESVGSSYLPSDRQTHFWIAYTQGLYKVYERIREKYPRVIIQACASGGGRVDYGALKYHQEVWTSDNTDAICRMFIQYGTNLIYPALVTGSHVSASPNHQTNNQTPLKFRFDLAMSGRLGMELQPKDLSEQEKVFAKKAIANYKQIRELVMYGDLYRVASPYDGSGYYALSYISKDKSKAVFYGYSFDYKGRTLTPRFRVNGLNPDKNYLLKELNTDKSGFWGDGRVFSGEYLMNEGINPKLMKVYDSIILYITETTK